MSLAGKQHETGEVTTHLPQAVVEQLDPVWLDDWRQVTNRKFLSIHNRNASLNRSCLSSRNNAVLVSDCTVMLAVLCVMQIIGELYTVHG